MSAPRALAERNVLPQVGPVFFRGDDGQVLFQFVIDTANIIGPRPATRADQERHAQAWGDLCAREALGALDRDGDGERGGSLPQESPAVPIDEQDYQPGEFIESGLLPRAKRRRKGR